MKKIMIVIIVVVVLVAGTIFYFMFQNRNNIPSKNDNALPPKTTNQTMVNEKTNSPKESNGPYVGDDFTITAPPKWIQTQMPSTLVSFQDPKEKHPEGSAAAKINFKSYIAVSFDNSSKTLEENVKLVKQQIQSVAPSISFGSETKGEIDNLPAKFIEASLNQQNIDFKVLVAIVVKDNKYFTISANTTSEKWTDYRDAFYNTANSFKFK